MIDFFPGSMRHRSRKWFNDPRIFPVALTCCLWSSVLAEESGSTSLDGPGLPNAMTLNLGGDIRLDVILIPAGTFLMGRQPTDADRMNDEKKANGTFKGEWSPLYTEYPQHEVTITRPYYLGKFEVTNEQFEKVMGYIPSDQKDPRFPVSGGSAVKGSKEKPQTITWDDSQSFCKKASAILARTVHLPTEAEWEYAARAGGPPCVFTFGMVDEIAWWGPSGDSKRHEVGGKKPNQWGLYDMFGNVYEWTQDWAAPYTADALVDPHGPDEKPAEPTKARKVVRGGGPYRNVPLKSLSTGKFGKPGGNEFSRADVGFRVVVEIPSGRQVATLGKTGAIGAPVQLQPDSNPKADSSPDGAQVQSGQNQLVQTLAEEFIRYGDPDVLRRLYAVDAASTTAALIKKLTEGNEEENKELVKNLAALELDNKGTAPAEIILPALLKVVKIGKDPWYRATAAGAISTFGPKAGQAVPFLIEALSDQAECVRRYSAMALGSVGPSAKEAIPVLEKLLTDEASPPKAGGRPSVAKEAAKAIRRIKGIAE